MKFISRVDQRVVKEDNKVLYGLRNLFRRLQFKLVTERLSSRGNEFRFSGRLVNERELRQGSFLGSVCVCLYLCVYHGFFLKTCLLAYPSVCLPARLLDEFASRCKVPPLAILLLPEDPISSVFLFRFLKISLSPARSRSCLSPSSPRNLTVKLSSQF